MHSHMNVKTSCISAASQWGTLPVTFTKQWNVAIPTTLQSHLFWEYPRPQLILFTEVHKSNARSFQLLYQLNLYQKNYAE